MEVRLETAKACGLDLCPLKNTEDDDRVSIMYNGEPIVPVRLATLNYVVDRFYIIEGTHSHSGMKKEGLFKDLNAH